MKDQIAIKKSLLYQSAELIRDKANILEKMTGDIQDAANNETKSSAGDKYETGRAMMQQEKDKFAHQLGQANYVLAQLKRINPEKVFDKIAFGTVVRTRLANYFIAISAGRVEVLGEKFYVISPQAPLAKELMGKQTGDTFVFNNQEIRITEVF